MKNPMSKKKEPEKAAEVEEAAATDAPDEPTDTDTDIDEVQPEGDEGSGESDASSEEVSEDGAEVAPPEPNAAAEALCHFGKLSADKQAINVAEIDAAFTAYLASDPSREDFCATLSGLSITPGMLYSALKAHH